MLSHLKIHIAKYIRIAVVGLAVGATLGLGIGAMMGLLHMRGASVLGLHLTPSIAGLLFGAGGRICHRAVVLFFQIFRSCQHAGLTPKPST